ncbi:MAG: XRE family transcriptional regulator [Phycisphaerales bacterium]|nr:XRE family transcriptional regulator [Phycisphaerales bacterium]
MKATRKNTLTRKRPDGRKTADALRIIDRITGRSSKVRAMIADATIHAQVAEMLHEARTESGLTQRELAALVGTKQPVIARLENADYNGHSLSMLNRIAAALGRRVRISFAAANR